jgi:ribosomal protein S18 acetylase RimI-like enzyme
MIRQFQPQDAEACCRLIRACLENDRSLSPLLRGKLLNDETPQSISERAGLFYVAVYEEENTICGLAGLDLNEIRILCVSPEHRRAGIGRALLDHLVAMAPGYLFADVFVYSSIRAVGFYKACGFSDKGPCAFDIGGEVLSTVFMTMLVGSCP